jgi:hypothetical protein
MSEERPNLEPLTAQLSAIREQLIVARQQKIINAEEVRRLSAAQAALLEKLIAANSRIKAKVNNLPTPEQRRRTGPTEAGKRFVWGKRRVEAATSKPAFA